LNRCPHLPPRARNLPVVSAVATRCGRARRWLTWQWCTAAR
jgi:hypothetical protein